VKLDISELVPIGATEKFFFGIAITKEHKMEHESNAVILKPKVIAVPFSNISSINYPPVVFNKNSWLNSSILSFFSKDRW